jgi:hypothetical protein
VTASIHLGFEVGSGRAVEIPLRHMAVTGQTQESGKTTTLEGLISRSGLRAVAYVTKRGESSFHVANPIAPYFRERADWKFVQSLLEASVETKMDFKQTWIMRACDGAKTLEDVRANIRKFLNGVPDIRPRKVKTKKKGDDDDEPRQRWIQKPARGLSGDVYYALDKYFDDVMPQLAAMPYSTELELDAGLNVMDLRPYEFPLQALVVRSVIDYIRNGEENTINVIPEAWKFAPKQKGSPVRQSAEELIREGGALKNFLWIDSQDLAGVADVLMRQVGVWIFGVQRAKHEIERALDHMPEGLPARRPRPQDIATLSKGQFYVCFGREMFKVYVQPAWMTAAHAEAIARGEEDVDSAREILKDFDHEQTKVRRAGSRGDRKATRGISGDDKAGAGIARNAGGDSPSGSVRDLAGASGDANLIVHSSSEVTLRSALREAPNYHHPENLLTPIFEAEEAEMNKSNEEFREALAKMLGTTPADDDDTILQALRALVSAHDKMARRNGTAGGPSASAVKSGGSGVTSTVSASAAGISGDSVITGEMGEWFKKFPKECFEATYQYVRKRARQDAAEILQMLVDHPELRVEVQRSVLEVDGSTLYGRICRLVSEGFFEHPQSYQVTAKEAIRRGWCSPKTPHMRVQDPLDKLAGLGFLTREADGYLAVPGMKVNIVE